MGDDAIEIVVALLAPATEFVSPFEELNAVPGATSWLRFQASPDLTRPYASVRKVIWTSPRIKP
jgi:hypothetical protein